MTKFYDITPVPKPRMTRSDKWRKPRRPGVARYFAFKDECRLKKVIIPECGARVNFYMPMPKSWSKKRKQEYALKPHKQTPDVDNLCKSIFDALYEDDSHIHDIRISKYWDYRGGIEVIT